MKIFDLTSLIESTINNTNEMFSESNLYIFNPSISHIESQKYLVATRIITRKGLDKESNNPWGGGPNSQTWWSCFSEITYIFSDRFE